MSSKNEKNSRRFPGTVGLSGRLKATGCLADAAGLEAFLVGGAVRDLLLGKKSLDLDVVVEGDPSALVKEAQRCWPGRIVRHEQFGTFTLERENGEHIDFATARKETYASPGALPVVKPGPLKDDLFRRDFTLNAIALGLNGKQRSKVIDHYGGMKDLEKGILRVLHPKSFQDDPTRLLRLARFAGRGFHVEPQTGKLALRDRGYLSRVSPERIREELLAILSEKDPRPALALLKKWGILKTLLPALPSPARIKGITRFSSVPERLAHLLSPLDEAERKQFEEHLKLPRRIKRFIEQFFAKPGPRPALNGNDLIGMGYKPGPLFKKILDSLSRHRFATRRLAMRFVIDNFPQKI
ncbi:MAG: CCA tRNA nucleotidyltransferase [Endomicrobiales bacterium]